MPKIVGYLAPNGLPVELDGDPILYHRLTGHRHLGCADVEELAMQGFVLRSPAARDADADDGERYGLQAIDEAAGDGVGIFFSVGAPIPTSKWYSHNAGYLSAPGVGFRLSRLLRHGDVDIRPRDLQPLYARVGDIQPLEALRRTYDDDDAFWLEVSELLQLIREAGDIPASPSRLHLLLHGDDAATRSFRGRLPSGFERRVARAAEEVAYMAVEAGFAYDPEDDSDEYRDEDAWAVPQLVDEIYETVSQAATEAAHGWLDAALHDVEAVFWGEQLPLWEASVIFCGDELRMFPPSA